MTNSEHGEIIEVRISFKDGYFLMITKNDLMIAHAINEAQKFLNFI